MKLYKIRAWVNYTLTKGKDKGRIQQESYHEKIIVNNLETAEREYTNLLHRVQNDGSYGARVWHAELFEPHIFDDGSLAYWPDNDLYIEKQERETD
jgi:hypothetical protein